MSIPELVLAAGLGVSLIGHLTTWIRDRATTRATSITAEAAVALHLAQGSGLLIQNLTTQYERMAALYEEALRALGGLRAEVEGLREQVRGFERIIDALPQEYRDLFAPVRLRTPRERPRPRPRIAGAD